MKTITTSLFALPLLIATTFVGAESIEFETLPPGTVVTTQFSSVTFSSTDGHENRVAADTDFGTGSYLITATVGGDIDAVNSTILDFTEPVNDLYFFAVGDDGPGIHAMVDVYVDGVFVAARPIGVDGIVGPDLVDLTMFGGVTKIEIWGITDPSGLAWDSFHFEPIPDDCPGDIDDDGEVGVTDLLAVLGAFGTSGDPIEDVTGDGLVSVADLLLVLGMWGPCP